MSMLDQLADARLAEHWAALPKRGIKAAPTQTEKDILALQGDPVFLRESLDIAVAELVISRARVEELEKTAGAYKASVEALQDAMADIGEDGDLWTFEDRHAAARDALAAALAKLNPKETT